MKTVFKVILIIMAIIGVICVALIGYSCGVMTATSISDDTIETKENATVEIIEQSPNNDNSFTDNTQMNEFNSISLDNAILLDKNNIKITAKYIDTCSIMKGVDLHIEIENNSNENITVQTRNTSVNGYMVETMCSQDIGVGKKAVTTIDFYGDAINALSLNDIENIEFSFHIFNSDDWLDIFDSDTIIIDIK